MSSVMSMWEKPFKTPSDRFSIGQKNRFDQSKITLDQSSTNGELIELLDRKSGKSSFLKNIAF